MDRRARRASTLLRAIVREIRAEQVPFLAGSIAYHAFVSLLPLLALVLAVVGTVGGGLEEGLISLTRAVLTQGAGDALVAELRQASASAGLSAVGMAALVWGTLRIFRGLDTAFSELYETEAANTFLDQLRDGLVVFLAVGVAIVVASAVESVADLGRGGAVGWLVGRVALVAGLTLALYPIYYVFPDTDVGALEVLPGVLTAAVGLTVFESLFRLYAAYSLAEGNPSVVAGILVFLTFLYVVGLVVLVGAAVNAVLSNRSRDVNVRPVLGGISPDERASEERAELVAALERLEVAVESAARADERDAIEGSPSELLVRAGDDTVSLPAPDAVESAVAGGLLHDGDVTLELRWAEPPEREEER